MGQYSAGLGVVNAVVVVGGPELFRNEKKFRIDFKLELNPFLTALIRFWPEFSFSYCTVLFTRV